MNLRPFMVFILHRYFFVVELLILTLISFFLAKGAGLLLADGIEERLFTAAYAEQLPAATHPRPTPSAEKPHYKLTVRGDAVLSRNLFDSSEGPISRNPEPKEAPPPPPEPNPELVRCAYPRLRLEATVAADEDPTLSVAAVSENKESRLYRIGDSLADGRVEMISWKYLIVESEGDYCYMDLFDTAAIRAKREGPPKRRELKRGIRNRGRDTRVIDRALFQRLVGNPQNLLRGIKVRPQKRGKYKGYLVRRVSRKHLAYLLGLRKRDLVTAINGQPIRDTNDALAALNRVRDRNQIEIDIVRKGNRKTLNARIR